MITWTGILIGVFAFAVITLVLVMMIKSGRISREEEIEFYRQQGKD